jgi:hypothetical protein
LEERKNLPTALPCILITLPCTNSVSRGKALISGMNLIDTSPNFSGGHSEAFVGDVLSGLVESEAIQRDV